MDFQHEEDFTETLDIETWRRLLKHLRPFRRLLIISMLLATSIAVLEISLPLLNRYAIDNLLDFKTWNKTKKKTSDESE